MKNRGSCSWDLQVRSEPGHGQKEKTRVSKQNQTAGSQRAAGREIGGLVLTAATSRIASE